MKKQICFWCFNIESAALKIQQAIDKCWPWLGNVTIHAYWFLQRISQRVHWWYYEGSEDEVDDALNLNCGDDLPRDLLNYSPRQQEIILRRAEWGNR